MTILGYMILPLLFYVSLFSQDERTSRGPMAIQWGTSIEDARLYFRDHEDELLGTFDPEWSTEDILVFRSGKFFIRRDYDVVTWQLQFDENGEYTEALGTIMPRPSRDAVMMFMEMVTEYTNLDEPVINTLLAKEKYDQQTIAQLLGDPSETMVLHFARWHFPHREGVEPAFILDFMYWKTDMTVVRYKRGKNVR